MLIAVLSAVMIFMAGMLFVNPLKDDVTSSRTTMDCTNSSISDGAKVTCLGIDIVVPYFMWAIFSVAGGLVIARFLL